MIFSPDGDRLVSTCRDRTVTPWDAGTGEELLTLRGHDSFVSAVAFSPEGRYLVTGEHRGMVRVWDTWTSE